ncbi:hypothetical protein, partial [Microvirga massiliensis]|uniref:hypothetical protein n=1 Tax=Microvirga massiliensis TaxID=1033741 RepID=UPI00062B95C4
MAQPGGGASEKMHFENWERGEGSGRVQQPKSIIERKDCNFRASPFRAEYLQSEIISFNLTGTSLRGVNRAMIFGPQVEASPAANIHDSGLGP